MKRLKRSLLILSVLTLTNFSFGQLNQSQVEAMFSEIDMKSYQNLKVITNKFDDNASNNTIKFDAKLTVLEYHDGFMIVKDGSDVKLFIPYDQITLVKVNPKTSAENANISIYVIE